MNNVRVLQTSQVLSLLPEEAQAHAVFGQFFAQEFHRQVDRALAVPDLVDISHPAAANEGFNAITIQESDQPNRPLVPRMQANSRAAEISAWSRQW